MSSNAVAAIAVILVSGFAGCAATAKSAEPAAAVAAPAIASFPTWTAADPAYRFYPGDQIDVSVLTAPELNRTVTVAPDGRIALPLIDNVMAADRTADEIHTALDRAYASQLRDAKIEVAAKSFGSRQVFIGGEVDKPGVYEIGAGADAMQAVIQAGGFKTSARRGQVLVLRRGGDGGSSVYRADLSPAAFRGGLNSLGPLERFDVVYVPRSPVAQVGQFMQQYVRDALPVQFSLYYDLAPNKR